MEGGGGERDNSAMQFGLNILMCLPGLCATSRREIKLEKHEAEVVFKNTTEEPSEE